MAYSVSLKYTVGVTDYTRSYNLLALKGFNFPDAVQFFPGINRTMLDGSLQRRNIGMRRAITCDFGVLQDSDDAAFLMNFLNAESASITYSSVEIAVVPFIPDGFENQWLDDCELGRRFIGQFLETVINEAWPDFIPTPSTAHVAYIKYNVEVTGTPASPETFTTNSGKLATMQNGSPYPTIDLGTYTVDVQIQSLQDCQITVVKGSLAQAGSDITFQLQRSDAGIPASDGKYYATITLIIQ